jgi:hypothetical protein
MNSSTASGQKSPGSNPTVVREGVLLGHGAGPYQHDPSQPMSYYIELGTPRGRRHAWGVDLHRAVTESRVQIGERIAAIVVGREAVRLHAPDRKSVQASVPQIPTTAFRNRWLIRRAAAPELRAQNTPPQAGSFRMAPTSAPTGPERADALLVRLSPRIADRLIPSSRDRQRFVTIANAVRRSPRSPLGPTQAASVAIGTARRVQQGPVPAATERGFRKGYGFAR